jgi:hypothetical protein
MDNFKQHAMKERLWSARQEDDEYRPLQDTLSEQEYEEYCREYNSYLGDQDAAQ